MAEGKKGSGNGQIKQSYSGAQAPIKKQGQESGTLYGMNPNVRQSGGKKK